MSTNDPTSRPAVFPEFSKPAVGLHAIEGLPSGFPDAAEIARMAGEMFADFPGTPHAFGSGPSFGVRPGHPVDSNPYAAVPGPTAPAAPLGVLAGLAPPLGGAPRFAEAAPVPAADPVTTVTPAAVPGLGDLAGVPGAGSFEFLRGARPLFTNPAATAPDAAAAPVPSRSTYKNASLDSVPEFGNSGSRPGQLTDIAQPPTPAIPSSFGFLDSSALPAFSFLEEGRPLLSKAPAPPGPVPAHGTNEVARDLSLSSYPFEVEAIRRDFPILQERVNGHPLIWFDNAATTQKPQSVIDRLSYFYAHENSNVHRAAHELAARATDAYESAREKTRRFLNAGTVKEIVFVRGATEAINLVAQSWGGQNVREGDEIVITWLEHHANIVPWQMLCAEKGARLRVAPVDNSGQILLDEYEKLLGPKTRLVSISQVSNALGTITPVKSMIESAHRHGARVLVDGAQAVSHMRTDVLALDCDFFVFSGHKVFAPTGIGVVYGKAEVLEHMQPWQGGGNMTQDVTFEKTTYQEPPQRFEAGTGNIADAVGLGAAIDYLDRVGIENISEYEHSLLEYATAAVLRIPGLRIIGTAKEKAGVLSFVLEGFRTEEIGEYLNRKGIAVRGGHHCAQPILRRFGLETTLRVSFAFYNTCGEVDALVAALWDLRQGRTPGVV
jgi:cysteine desulfurase/selenocysteine lyase